MGVKWWHKEIFQDKVVRQIPHLSRNYQEFLIRASDFKLLPQWIKKIHYIDYMAHSYRYWTCAKELRQLASPARCSLVEVFRVIMWQALQQISFLFVWVKTDYSWPLNSPGVNLSITSSGPSVSVVPPHLSIQPNLDYVELQYLLLRTIHV